MRKIIEKPMIILMPYLRDGLSFLIYILTFWVRRKGIVTLVYHSVGREDPSKDPYRLNMTPERLEEHLKVISRYRDSVRITFDDGYGNNSENAFPLLRKYDCTATVFVITDFIDGKIKSSEFCGRELELRPLTWEEIKIMDNSGITIGSHSKTHAALAGLSRGAIKEELADSKKRIETSLGHAIDKLSYPFGSRGSFNRTVSEVAAETGYRYAYTNIMGINKENGKDNLALKRVRIYSEDGPLKLKMKIHGAYDWVDAIL